MSILSIEDHEKRIENLEKHQASLVVPVASFEPAPYKVVGNISVVIKPSEDEFTASYFDGDLHASGDTEQEAYDNVKSMMVAMYEKLNSLPAEKLGPIPTRQKSVLNSVMARI